ncbi:MAG TPA: TIR domain-containing protein [Blastocatellia bacterium]|nr:TIR domain-containing protein [Blastocatellia bacterium]
MYRWSNHPTILEINTMVWLNALTHKEGKQITLATIPIKEIERIADYGFDGIWLMGVWERSPEGRRFDQQDSNRHEAFLKALGDYRSEDVAGSPYAIHRYQVDSALGGDDELAAFRDLLRRYGLHLMLDFVPNHLALDHSWLADHPEWFLQGDQEKLLTEPRNYFPHGTGDLLRIFAHGKDPYFDGWPDTVQLDYRNADTRKVMSDTLFSIAERCDGVRCDLAMLVTHDVFVRSWGGEFDPPDAEFWPDAIKRVKTTYPEFLMMAEVYWNMEGDLQQQGFDYTYDKGLYDLLLKNDVPSVKSHLQLDLRFQNRLVRFIENHDEARAVTAFGIERNRAAAAITLTLPGLRLLHDGQIEGFQLRLPVQLRRRTSESPDQHTEEFYRRLLNAICHPIFHNGDWKLLDPQRAWPGNESHTDIIAFIWILGEERRLVVVNLSPDKAQCYLPLTLPELAGYTWHLNDRLTNAHYLRVGDELLTPGLYIDMPGYGYHLFELQPGSKKLPSAITPMCTFKEHKKGIYTVAWSPQGHMLASAGEEKVIRIWSVEGCKSICCLEGHQEAVDCISWSPDGRMLASGSRDKRICIWDVDTWARIKELEGHTNNIMSLSWSPDSSLLLSGSLDQTIILWDVKQGQALQTLEEHADAVNSLVWSRDGKVFISGSGDKTIRIWDAESRETIYMLKEKSWVSSIGLSPDGNLLATGTGDGVITIWDVQTGQPVAICEGHSDRILCVSFSADGRLLASKSADDTIRFWKCYSWEELLTLREEFGTYLSGIAFHPQDGILATRDDKENTIQLLRLNIDELLFTFRDAHSIRYANAKVILVGESSTGKTCLGRALMGEPFEPQSSTNARKVWTFSQQTVTRSDGSKVINEILLWDLAGQPDYRLIHQLHLTEVAVALVLFDSRPDPFAGVYYWSRALSQAQRVQEAFTLPMKKFLVASRTDVGSVGIQLVKSLLTKLNFDSYFETSAKEGQNINRLASAICSAIDWEALPIVSSTQLFQSIKSFLVAEKAAGRLLASIEGLYRTYTTSEKMQPESEDLRAEFYACIGRVEARGLIQQLSFGNFVLLQPELLDAYASAVANAAKENPDGFGYINETEVYKGEFYIPKSFRIEDREQERLLLIAVVEDLIRHEIALREQGLDGSYLVFPSQFTREMPEISDPLGKSVLFSFKGAILNIYATLAVRLSHSGLFKKKAMWKNAASYTAIAGGTCGILLREIEEGHGELTLFFDSTTNEQTRYEFEEYVHSHLKRHALSESIQRQRMFICQECKMPLSEAAIKYRLERGFNWISCNACGYSPISLLDREDRLTEVGPSKVPEIDGKVDDEIVWQTPVYFDVFLCHNSADKSEVKHIGQMLKDRQIRPWLDEWELRPGVPWQKLLEQQIEKIKSVAVFIGSQGIGPWQRQEIDAFLREFVDRNCPVIPVLLPTAPTTPDLPLFLRGLTWVDFRGQESDAVSRLVWGITGERC